MIFRDFGNMVEINNFVFNSIVMFELIKVRYVKILAYLNSDSPNIVFHLTILLPLNNCTLLVLVTSIAIDSFYE